MDIMKNNETYQPKYNTIAHKTRQIDESVGVESGLPDLKTLDMLIDNSKKYISKKENYTKEEIKEILQKIDSNIKQHLPDQASSYTTSLIYLAIGEKFNLPLRCVADPHVSIEYDENKFITQL